MPRVLLGLIPSILWSWPVWAQSRITVTLYDLAGLSPEIREAMKKETTRIFLEAGVALDWVECEVAGQPVNLTQCAQPLGPARLMLQVVSGSNKTKAKAAGMAVIQGESSVFACLYPDRVNQLARDAGWQIPDLLGHAAAHELGHLLLRSSEHSSAGVMRARWETEDLRKLSHAGLIFLPGQLNVIQAAVSQQRPSARQPR